MLQRVPKNRTSPTKTYPETVSAHPNNPVVDPAADTLCAPSAFATRAASNTPIPRNEAARNPPQKQSPAPVESTARTEKPGTTTPSTVHPAAPRFTTTRGPATGPNASISAAFPNNQSKYGRHGPTTPIHSPIRSHPKSIDVVQPASRASRKYAAAFRRNPGTANGFPTCNHRTPSPYARKDDTPSNAAVNTPGRCTSALAPSSRNSPIVTAVPPVNPGKYTPSTPTDANRSLHTKPCKSSPQPVTSRTRAPNRAAAYAVVPPFPPSPVANSGGHVVVSQANSATGPAIQS